MNVAQKEYKTKPNWVSKMIHWKLGKKLKFDPTNKWYMRYPAFVREKETHKLLWDFEMQTDHLISARPPDLLIINKRKRTRRIVDIAIPVDNKIKLKENEKRISTLTLLGN